MFEKAPQVRGFETTSSNILDFVNQLAPTSFKVNQI
jgi:hypothetical protein